ncbi:phosphatase PAP2 family protein [Parvibaculum sedimenti]|uniref:Phosphatase PAP2 family protein n=2 Tax=Parvibaculum sedimenti TaxID=2608632 RepID=A0A6N6VIM6_9HYPH|nr:phosphatase PAP2 family protein [Parvibaculum sedimenti]KAB7740727.1 phosphatase PAP2 family protein [Parvibaculum sedimenti]
MHLSQLLYFITAFGDQAVILPFAITVAIVLAAARARRAALIWCIALAASLGGSLIAKIVFISCGHLLPALDIRSPSGHTTAAIAAYGGFAALWAQLARARWTRALFIAGALAGCGGIAASRILLHMHSAPEVLLGALIGLAAPIILYRVEPPASEPRPRPTLLLLLLPLCLVFILRGTTLPIESRIDQLSKALTAMLGICH